MTKGEKNQIEEEIGSIVGFPDSWRDKNDKLTPEGWLKALKCCDREHYKALETAVRMSSAVNRIKRVLREYYDDRPDWDSKFQNDKEVQMSYKIFLTGNISIPKGVEIPEKYKWCITGKPHAILHSGDKVYDVYYITASVSTCSGDEETLKNHFTEIAKELNALSFTGVLANDRDEDSAGFFHWNREFTVEGDEKGWVGYG